MNNKPSFLPFAIFLGFIFGLLIIRIIADWDRFPHQLHNWGKAKDYKLPKPIKLVFDGKEYAIKDTESNEYLWYYERYDELTWMYSTIDKPLTFKDSSMAKGAYKYKSEVENADRAKGFK